MYKSWQDSKIFTEFLHGTSERQHYHTEDAGLVFVTRLVGTCVYLPLHRHVALHMQREMVRARESSLAEPALERPVASVLAVVASQLVRAGELPAASLPAALVRLLARVRAEVRLQVRRLGVRLAAPRVRTRVHNYFPATPVPSASGFGWWRLTCGTR